LPFKDLMIEYPNKRLKGLQKETERLPSSLPENGDNPSPLLNYKITPETNHRSRAIFRVGII